MQYQLLTPGQVAEKAPDETPEDHYGIVDNKTDTFVGFFVDRTVAEQCLAALNAPKFPMRIVEFIREGEISIDPESRNKLTTNDLLDAAGRMMDRACTHDILGAVVFKCEDGQWYVLNVEAEIGLINPEYLKDLRDEDREEE